MFPGIRRSFYRFLALYILSTAALIAIGEYLYYRYALHQILDKERAILEQLTQELILQLKKLHQSFAPTLVYPQIEAIESALFDIDENYLIGTFHPQLRREPFWIEDGLLYKRTSIYPYYLGAATIVTAKPIDQQALRELHQGLLLFSLFALGAIVLTAILLGRLFLQPAQHSLALLDQFIKDATHELNTPISTIVTNIELFKELHPEVAREEELTRIELAARRLTKIFNDLAFLQLNHQRARNFEAIQLDSLLHERLAYFKPQIRSKGLQMELRLRPVTLQMDRSDAESLIDNLLSNAIKYNRPGGTITIELDQNHLTISDTGIGIPKAHLSQITRRFVRAHPQEGGFGLGLYIVRQIVRFYRFTLTITSQEGKGTEVKVAWHG
ncbi:MAG: hypothetical protein C6I00_06565 [Nitratiruptor sp.]|nr:hypothetical protein [Nitratiruptor sp.]NPA83106.1 hypothetical protein [Campylobacterota bacterium]